jgi:hypothetical protein
LSAERGIHRGFPQSQEQANRFSTDQLDRLADAREGRIASLAGMGRVEANQGNVAGNAESEAIAQTDAFKRRVIGPHHESSGAVGTLHEGEKIVGISVASEVFDDELRIEIDA